MLCCILHDGFSSRAYKLIQTRAVFIISRTFSFHLQCKEIDVELRQKHSKNETPSGCCTRVFVIAET